MRRKLTATVETGDLPELTPQQQKFVELVVSGKTATDAYRGAYDVSTMLQSTVWAAASRLKNDCKVSAWIAAAYKAKLGSATLTREQHIAELENLRQIALETGNVGAAVQAEQLRGKAMGHYVDRVETTDLTDINKELKEIERISPDLAKAYAKDKGLSH